ncbi:restriction endonuclease subunit S [Flavicella sediminum]|uniref:restriction endonuclease subunit S n=1 Tax=Flavicella sediminum TaxID=2585141 RepID=UPI001121A6D4|nr:restriction endonuclease subunit S [Flavicella sediminum]
MINTIVDNKVLNLDKTNWTPTKLGDLATDILKRVDNPSKSEYDRFVSLRSFVSGDIKIKFWDSTDGLASSAKAFQAGDILFARRNAYLRRASLVDFDGCCSGDAFVLRENHDKVEPGFLAFLMNSNALWDYANSNAAGTMSKRVKWRDLAEYEFLLPPKDQQVKLAELLWSMDEVIEKEIELKNVANVQYEVSKSNLVLEGLNNQVNFSENLKRDVAERWNITTIGDLIRNEAIIKVQDGNHGEIHPKSADYVDEGIPFIMANTLIDGEIDFNKSKKLPRSITDKLRIGFSYPNDVLLSHKGTVGEVAIVPDKIDYPYLMLTPQVTLYRTNESKLKHKFLYYVFNSSYFQNQILRLSSQSTRAYVGITSQRGFKLAIPDSVIEQERVIEVLTEVEKNRKLIDYSIESSKNIQKSIINQIF